MTGATNNVVAAIIKELIDLRAGSQLKIKEEYGIL